MTHKLPDQERELTVETLARVEGEGAMRVVVRDGQVADVQLQIYEPPRFFEALLRGRGHTEPPDITSRICGICPVAYEMSACLAIEDACGVAIPDQVRLMRRLLYCGEWIESHALHVYLLHAPDFLGYPGAVELAQDHRDVVERGLRLKKAGNAILTLVGGRAVHPINIRVGGFYRFPSPDELRVLRHHLEHALDDALATVTMASGFDFPDFEQDYEYVALRTDHDYPIETGSFVTSSGRSFAASEFGDWVHEQQVPHSHALHASLRDVGAYVVGPLARYSLNHDHLTPLARQAADAAGLGATCRNPFRSIVVRAVEIVVAVEEALRLIDRVLSSEAGAASVPVAPRAGVGHGATEAPRGVLYHRYELAADGTVLDAQIVPPTSQNQASIESDLRGFVQARLHLDTEELTRQCEQAIRNYDPCISCATHFLDLTLDAE
ncbi:MAG TPA: Ni/Fe hydrogenase subunit alpha [Nocardioidaceae bacterium]|nr:Ni/Fe hydrogenase subunit alpha [Nocardioidaceae bacterium]